MKADNYFEIGTSHEVCQDYALSGNINDDIAYAIVADGCTMSHNECAQVDFGARVLAHAAKDTVNRLYVDKNEVNTPKEEKSALNKFIREKAIITTRMIERHIDLHPLFADCTLLTAMLDKNGRCEVFLYGDGNAFVRLKNGWTIIVDVTFLSGAPLYLSYQTDPSRKAAYVNEWGDIAILVDQYTYAEDGELITKNATQTNAKDPEVYDKMMFTFGPEVEYVSLMSDGVKSFMQNVDGEFNPLDYQDIIRDINNFKNKNGVYVQRRMKSVAKRHKKEDITHYDDVSVASAMV